MVQPSVQYLLSDQLEGCNAHHAQDVLASYLVSGSRSEHTIPFDWPSQGPVVTNRATYQTSGRPRHLTQDPPLGGEAWTVRPGIERCRGDRARDNYDATFISSSVPIGTPRSRDGPSRGYSPSDLLLHRNCGMQFRLLQSPVPRRDYGVTGLLIPDHGVDPLHRERAGYCSQSTCHRTLFGDGTVCTL